jgi:hypothetical protein
VAFAADWSDAGSIEDVRSTSLDLDGRQVTISSTFRHRTRALSVLGGLGHSLFSSHVRMSYLVGVAFTEVTREFVSNAPGLVLVPPSRVGPLGVSSTTDHVRSLTGGAEGTIRITRHVHARAGVRVQELPHLADASGWSVRTFAGAGWVF